MSQPLRQLAERLRPRIDGLWDPAAALVWNPPGSLDDEGVPGRSLHQVPQSAWHLLDLAERGDERVPDAVDALLALQYRTPGTPWHGTFARFAEIPEPTAGAVEWEDYDPNWRQFVGIALQQLLAHHGDLLDPAQRGRVEDAIALAAEGEQQSGRLHWWYTNIALQHAWFLVEADRVEEGEALAERVVEGWREHGSFQEFNSPTYDGVDLWALALWRGHSRSERLRAWGAELEAGLWRTVAGRYHAGLRNVAGPHTRAYGLDLDRYVGKVALLIAGATDVDAAPLPSLDDEVIAHGHDLQSLPSLALAPPVVPDDALAHLRAFQGERTVHDVISTWPTRREATAWLGDDVMIGAEDGDSDWMGWYQFVAGTVHWRCPDGRTGVLRYVPGGPPRGRAEPGVLRIGSPGRIEVHDPEPAGVLHTTKHSAADAWVSVLDEGTTELSGLRAELRRDGDGFVLEVRPVG
ncbi:MAG: hypothetical protein ACLGIC_07500 [Acidimicrobiia bacterium]